MCCEEAEEEEGEEEGVPLTEEKTQLQKTQRMAHVPPPCSSAPRGTELMLVRVSQLKMKLKKIERTLQAGQQRLDARLSPVLTAALEEE